MKVKRRVEINDGTAQVPESPAPIPEGKYLLRVNGLEAVPADDKYGGIRVATTVMAGDFQGRNLVGRLFDNSPVEASFKKALHLEGDEIDETTVKGKFAWGFTANKPRRDKQGLYTVITDWAEAKVLVE